MWGQPAYCLDFEEPTPLQAGLVPGGFSSDYLNGYVPNISDTHRGMRQQQANKAGTMPHHGRGAQLLAGGGFGGFGGGSG
eukprot:CAMPEP_0203889154 /NCGR_PEP_ID=MMETSP0359-20131031/32719_1 /ASSEMBLY_ACC=CAM_ASM_000338 /TAXON_ID=268821 /ORGANISM="Scrippsiella Hangoei, Strain SHTV-5" /LENGTH=79 /DNA_ID=CAMNT_0050810493 /DNA_START=110 /DNA_END=345 /DNA_ORIENTATION=+